MKVINKEDNFSEVGSAIREGKIVIFPTETIYGIGTNALLEEAVKKIFLIKERDEKKALIVLISDISMLERIAYPPTPIEEKLIRAFWPGPLTIIFKKKENISSYVSGGMDTVAVRMTDCEITKRLIQISGVPIVAPSANLSGKTVGKNIEELKDVFDEKVDYIIDGGMIENTNPSTLVEVVDGKVHILRKGMISEEEIIKKGFSIFTAHDKM